jgi:hypothetical protein
VVGFDGRPPRGDVVFRLPKADMNLVKRKTGLTYQQVLSVCERYGIEEAEQAIKKIKELGVKPKRWKHRRKNRSNKCRTRKRGS